MKARLKRRAGHHGRSTEGRSGHILRDAVKEQNRRVTKLGSRIAALFATAELSTDLPELHVQVPRSAEFAKIIHQLHPARTIAASRVSTC